VQAKADEAVAFLSQDNWHVGVWEIRDVMHTLDLTIRPDGHYIAREQAEYARGIVRGRYAIEDRRIQAFPYVGQDIYMHSNPDYGKYEWKRELDYYDGELQLIDLEAFSQSVTLARKRPDSEAVVAQKTAEAHAQRARPDWYVGVWEVNDPVGWMGFTLRPDGGYIGQAGAAGVASEVERGRYLVNDEKLTLAPYGGLRQGRRAFELDLYDGDLFLVGDASRLVVARKVDGSESTVIAQTRDPAAAKGERGSILGLWTANMPGHYEELVFRPDGEFRLKRCSNNTVSHDYGLYSADMAARTAVYDSRFVPVETLGMDFYGDTLTLFGGLGAPRSYTVNLGQVDAAIAASLVADAEEAAVDAQWLARVPLGPRDPGWVQVPTATIPADPNPAHVFDSATVFTNFQFYRRLIPGFVYFNEWGTIRSVPVVNTREFSFFPGGRALVRFTNYRAGIGYPNTVADVSDSWGAYRIEPKPGQNDILHRFADNVLFIESDSGELTEMTLEDGRRNLFLEKDYQLLSEWASEQQTIPCEPPPGPDPSLMNTGLSLSSTLPLDEVPRAEPLPPASVPLQR
jgi:hypothetical protein